MYVHMYMYIYDFLVILNLIDWDTTLNSLLRRFERQNKKEKERDKANGPIAKLGLVEVWSQHFHPCFSHGWQGNNRVGIFSVAFPAASVGSCKWVGQRAAGPWTGSLVRDASMPSDGLICHQNIRSSQTPFQKHVMGVKRSAFNLFQD